jgi:hypothetical protein
MKPKYDIGELLFATLLVVAAVAIVWYAINYVFVEPNVIIKATW